MPVNPLISIITVNLNNLGGLKKTMKSVLEQTYRDFEYIVMDGGSTDGSKEYIQEFTDKLSHWVSEPDRGIYHGMNKGIKMANGDYLLFLNSGDHLYSKNVLRNIHQEISGSDIIYFNLQFVNKNTSYIRKYPDQLSFSYFCEDTLPHPATFIKAELFEKYGLYNESLRIVSDWEFFLRIICSFNVAYRRIDTVLSSFYLDGISSSPNNQIMIYKERERVLQENYKLFLQEVREKKNLEKKVAALRASKKIKLFTKLGLIKKI